MVNGACHVNIEWDSQADIEGLGSQVCGKKTSYQYCRQVMPIYIYYIRDILKNIDDYILVLRVKLYDKLSALQ